MKKIILFLAMTLSAWHVLAQDVSIDKKSGLVQVNGKPAFYLSERNRILFDVDFSLENLQHTELAFIKLIKTKQWNSATRTYDDVNFYTITFTKTKDFCELHDINSFALKKSLSKNIAAAGLVVDGQISDAAEQKFIVIHNGIFFNDPRPAPPPVVVNVNGDGHGRNTGNNSGASINISLNGDKIYNNDRLIGTFKSVNDGRRITTSIYDQYDNKQAVADHVNGTEDDWNLTLMQDGKRIQVRYHVDTPLIALFRFVVQEGYL